MRHALLFAPLLTLALAAALSSCGGSSSETPPPIEPDPASLGLGPTGENTKPPTIVEDRGSDSAGRRDGGRSRTP
jgi:hypothetical protein